MEHAYAALADEQLLEQCSLGDQRAFEALVERYQHQLSPFISRLLSPDEAQDVLQFVWLQLYRSLSTLQRTHTAASGPIYSLRPWLFQIARNRCISLHRERKRKARCFSDATLPEGEDGPWLLLPDPDPMPEQYVEQQEVRQGLIAALAHLPSPSRHIVWLRYTTDLTFAQIGEHLGLPEGTAKTYYFRARARLRVLLQSRL